MKYLIIIFLSLGIISQLNAQTKKPRNWTLYGYTSFMNTNSFDSIKNMWSIDNQIHNRLNFEYYANQNITFVAQLRTRFIYGNSVLIIPKYADIIAKETGWMELNKNILSEKNYLLNMNLDRFYFKYSKGKWDFHLGRQRINWGRTLVWNPNDIFNTYSYFDFDYEEKPGSDAFRAQYYYNATSLIDFAASVNHDEELTVAAKWLVNKWNYDFQFIAGEMQQKDYVAGFGWAGAIKNIGFRGEATYFHPIDKNDSLREASIVATVSLDYTFKNSLNIMYQLLYSPITKDNPISNFASFYNANLNAKYLSFTEWNMFVSAKYPLTPLLNISLAGMYYPKMKGMFLNPSLDYSLSDNMEFSFVYQYFKGDTKNPFTGITSSQQFNFVFLRLKRSF